MNALSPTHSPPLAPSESIRTDGFEPFRLGDVRVVPALHEIERGGETEKVEPRLMRLLCLLASAPGRVFSRGVLLDAVWGDGQGQDEALTQAVSRLRRILDDRDPSARLIETIPKSGYRLAVPVHPEASPEPAPPAEALARRRAVWVWGAVAVVVGAVGAAWLWTRLAASASANPQPTSLTTLRGMERDPAIGPDGLRIAFAWDGGGTEAPGLFVKQIGSETPLRLTRPEAGEDRLPVWSPDGRWVAFSRSDSSGRAVYVVPSLGGPERLVTTLRSPQVEPLAWTPDGEGLVITDRLDEGGMGLRRVAVDGASTRTLTTPPGPTLVDLAPTFSLGGDRLAFIRRSLHGIEDIYVIDLPDGTPRRVTTWQRAILALGWSGDGESLLAASLVDGGFRLFRLRLGGGAPEVVFAGTEPLSEAALDAARGQLVYVASDVDVNVWSFLEGADEAELRVSSTVWDSHPRLSPGGRRLAFASVRDIAPEIWISNADGSWARRMTRFLGPYVGSPSWSPNGYQLAFDVRDEGQSDLYAVEAGGGSVRRLTETPHDEVLPSWSHDGTRLYFASNASGTWQVMQQDLTEREAVPVTTGSGYFAQEALDGRSLYFTRLGEPGLWQKDLPDGPERRVLDAPAASHWGAWDVTDRGLLVLRPGEDAEVRLVDLEAGTDRPWATLPPPVAAGQRAFSASADGRTLYYSRVERMESDLRRLVWPDPL